MNPPDFIPYGRQTIEEDDVQAVVDVLRSAYLTTGPKVREFELVIEQRLSVAHAVTFSSGTAALHAAYAVAGIGQGDEILVPTMSFLATANAALYVGAKPVFVDSVRDGFNLDLEDARRKVSTRTKAIVPVHFAGEPVDLDAVHRFAQEQGLLVIEDAAHAFGAIHQGKMIGSISDMTVFSFHPVKSITTAEGGAVTTPHADLARRLRQFRHHGIDIDVRDRDARQSWRYDMTELGYNYRLSDLQSALGISQLCKLNRFLDCRETIAKSYDEGLGKIKAIQRPPHARPGDKHAWHLYIIRLLTEQLGLERDEVFSQLRSKGIGVHVHYRPIHLHSYYHRMGWRPGDCPQSEATFSRLLSLPIFPTMTHAMAEHVLRCITDAVSLPTHGGTR